MKNKIQLAIDRVSIEKALEYINAVENYVDIVEVGTSLIKDFGMASIRTIKKAYPHKSILADMKVMDEGEYEFTAAYKAGADIVTVMGAAALKTITACKKVANEMGRDYMIDLLEVDGEKLSKILAVAGDAIFCVHLPSDQEGRGLTELVQSSVKMFSGKERLAVAGGVKLDSVRLIKEAGFEIVIIGGAITRAENMAFAAKQFYQRIAE